MNDACVPRCAFCGNEFTPSAYVVRICHAYQARNTVQQAGNGQATAAGLGMVLLVLNDDALVAACGDDGDDGVAAGCARVRRSTSTSRRFTTSATSRRRR